MYCFCVLSTKSPLKCVMAINNSWCTYMLWYKISLTVTARRILCLCHISVAWTCYSGILWSYLAIYVPWYNCIMCSHVKGLNITHQPVVRISSSCQSFSYWSHGWDHAYSIIIIIIDHWNLHLANSQRKVEAILNTAKINFTELFS